MEYLQKRWSALKDAFSIPGVAGQVPTVPVVSWLLNNIDPGLADLVTGGMQERNLEQVEAEKSAIAMMLTGTRGSVSFNTLVPLSAAKPATIYSSFGNSGVWQGNTGGKGVTFNRRLTAAQRALVTVLP